MEIFYNDIEKSKAKAFALLVEGVGNRVHGFHHPVLSLATPDGMPSGCIVILRMFDAEQRVVRFHTDARSEKIKRIRANPHAAMTFYDYETKIQVRLTGVATIHTEDAIANEAWENTRLFSKRCYLTNHGTSSLSNVPTSGLPLEFDNGAMPTIEEAEGGRKNFSVVRLKFDVLEWLYLASTGHRRARITWYESGNIDSTWIVP